MSYRSVLFFCSESCPEHLEQWQRRLVFCALQAGLAHLLARTDGRHTLDALAPHTGEPARARNSGFIICVACHAVAAGRVNLGESLKEGAVKFGAGAV